MFTDFGLICDIFWHSSYACMISWSILNRDIGFCLCHSRCWISGRFFVGYLIWHVCDHGSYVLPMYECMFCEMFGWTFARSFRSINSSLIHSLPIPMIVWHDIVSRTSLNFVLDAFHPFQLKSDQLEKAMSPMIYPWESNIAFSFLHSPKMLFPLHHLCFPIILSIDWTFSMNSTILYVILVPNFFLLKHKHPKR